MLFRSESLTFFSYLPIIKTTEKPEAHLPHKRLACAWQGSGEVLMYGGRRWFSGCCNCLSTFLSLLQISITTILSSQLQPIMSSIEKYRQKSRMIASIPWYVDNVVLHASLLLCSTSNKRGPINIQSSSAYAPTKQIAKI